MTASLLAPVHELDSQPAVSVGDRTLTYRELREMEVRLEHPVEGTISALGVPVKLSDTPGAVRRPAPLLGEHTGEVLREAGFSAQEIEALG